MAVGAYSIVRFSDNMRDERVNLGVIVWHPQQGFEHIIPKTLDRARAIDPLLDSQDIKTQIAFLKNELSSDGVDGMATLTKLSKMLREGFQVSAPFPTRLSGAKECANHLFQTLVAKIDRAAGIAAEIPIREKLSTDLRDISQHLDPNAIVQNMGERHIDNVRVDIGIRTKVQRTDLLWRLVSLNTRNIDDQLSRAKSTAMDIVKIRGVGEFDNYRHVVALQKPAKIAVDTLSEATRWLEGEADRVTIFQNQDEIPAAISAILEPVA